MKKIRLFLVLTLVCLLLTIMVVPATAFIHITIPADECAPEAAGDNPGNNPTAQQAILAAIAAGNPGLSLPLGGLKNAPTDCPAP